MGKLARFFLSRWNLFDALQMNFESEGYPFDRVLRFFRASSDFYPEFDDLLRHRVRKWLKQQPAYVKQEDEANS